MSVGAIARLQGPHITRRAVLAAKEGLVSFKTLKARAEALEREADQCDHLYPWPALANSLRDDAAQLRAILKGTK